MSNLSEGRMLPALAPDAFAVEIESGDAERKTRAIAALNARIRAAEDGDQAALAEVQAVYAAVPRLMPSTSALTRTLEESIFDAGNMGPYSRWIAKRQLDELRRDLAGPNPSPLESLLVDRAVLCHLEALHWDELKAVKLREPHSAEVGEYYGKRSEQAQRQFLRACRTLATVRRLEAPVAQINFGAQQINVAGDLR